MKLKINVVPKTDNSLSKFKDIQVNRKLNQSIQELRIKFKFMETGLKTFDSTLYSKHFQQNINHDDNDVLLILIRKLIFQMYLRHLKRNTYKL